MALYQEKRSSKCGLAPGTPIHLGKQKTPDTRITLYQYHHDQLCSETFVDQWPTIRNQDSPSKTWIHVQGIHNIDVLTGLANDFGIHPLVIEDITNTHQRPKLEDYGHYLFLVVRQLVACDHSKELASEQFSLILGKQFVLSFQEGSEEWLSPLSERLNNPESRLRNSGSDYLAYEILDFIIDHYFATLEDLDQIVDQVEEDLEAAPSPSILRALHILRRQLIISRKSIWPLREVLSHLERSPNGLVKETTRPFLRDVHDHTVTVIESLEIFRDLIGGMLELYHTTMSTKMNETIKLLTITATLFLPLTLITGMFGMNFQHLPGLGWQWAFPVFLLTMVSLAGGMFMFFKKRMWV